MNILLVQLEFYRWSAARQWSYSAQLGIEEGLRANGVEFTTFTTPWLRHAREICKGKQFDQVWVEVVHSDLDENWMQWLADLAPVRVGMAAESLEYSPQECALYPALASRPYEFERRVKFLTHVLVGDEVDAEKLSERGVVKALWWPQAVPKRFILNQYNPPTAAYATFSGMAYGERKQWLAESELKSLMVRQPSPEEGTLHPLFFDCLHLAVRCFHKTRLSGATILLPPYLQFLRRMRQRAFARWVESLRDGCAVVNLPSFFKAYPGRVVEAMAAGRPVISWEIPDRPRTKALFREGKEILLYSPQDPLALARHIKELISNPELGQSIASNARDKVSRFHTMEARVGQWLRWLGTGEVPTYG